MTELPGEGEGEREGGRVDRGRGSTKSNEFPLKKSLFVNKNRYKIPPAAGLTPWEAP